MNSCARSKVWIPGSREPGIRWDADSLRGNDVRGSARQNEDAPSVVESRRRRCAHVTLPSASQQRYYPRHRRSKTFPPELIKEFQAGYRGEPSRIRLMFVNRCAEWTSPRDRFAGDCAHRHPVAPMLALRDRAGASVVFSWDFRRFLRSREERRRNEGRPRRGGSRSAGDRLASRVSWSGVGAPGTPARGRRMVDRTAARPNAVARVSQQGGWIPLYP